MTSFINMQSNPSHKMLCRCADLSINRFVCGLSKETALVCSFVFFFARFCGFVKEHNMFAAVQHQQGRIQFDVYVHSKDFPK